MIRWHRACESPATGSSVWTRRKRERVFFTDTFSVQPSFAARVGLGFQTIAFTEQPPRYPKRTLHSDSERDTDACTSMSMWYPEECIIYIYIKWMSKVVSTRPYVTLPRGRTELIFCNRAITSSATHQRCVKTWTSWRQDRQKRCPASRSWENVPKRKNRTKGESEKDDGKRLPLCFLLLLWLTKMTQGLCSCCVWVLTPI